MDCSKNLRGTSKKCRLEGFFRNGMEDLWDSLLAISPGILKDASSFMIFVSLSLSVYIYIYIFNDIQSLTLKLFLMLRKADNAQGHKTVVWVLRLLSLAWICLVSKSSRFAIHCIVTKSGRFAIRHPQGFPTKVQYVESFGVKVQ